MKCVKRVLTRFFSMVEKTGQFGQTIPPVGNLNVAPTPLGCATVIWVAQGHTALLHMSPNLQTDLSLVFVGVGLW